MSKALARQLELAEVYLDEIGIVGGHNATLARRARDQVAHVRAALESEEVVAEGVVELERGNCCRTRADEEGWGHIRVYIGAHWPAPKHSRRVRIVAVK